MKTIGKILITVMVAIVGILALTVLLFALTIPAALAVKYGASQNEGRIITVVVGIVVGYVIAEFWERR